MKRMQCVRNMLFRKRAQASVATLTAVLATACADVTSTDAAGTREFRGRYVSGFKASAFLACE